MKKQIIATVLIAAFAAPTFADTDNFRQELFDNQIETVKVTELSQQEMKDTQGAFIGLTTAPSLSSSAALSTLTMANANAWAYHLQYYQKHGTLGNPGGAAAAATAGAVTGGTASLIRASGGGIAGAVAWKLGTMPLNATINHINALGKF